MSSGVEGRGIYSRSLSVSGDSVQYAGDPNGSKTNFTYNLGTNLQAVTKVSFLSVTFRNNAYNVNATGGGINNVCAVSINGVTYQLTVPPGFYTTATLMSAMQTAVQTIMTGLTDDQTFTLTQDPLSQLVSATYTAGGSGFSTMQLLEVNNQFGPWDLLGFDIYVPDEPITLHDSVATIATNLPQLGGLTTAYLRSQALAPGEMFDSGGFQKNYALSMPITVPFGVLNLWECKVDKHCEISYPTPRNLQLIDFALVDKQGDLVDLHGANMVINMRVWFSKY